MHQSCNYFIVCMHTTPSVMFMHIVGFRACIGVRVLPACMSGKCVGKQALVLTHLLGRLIHRQVMGITTVFTGVAFFCGLPGNKLVTGGRDKRIFLVSAQGQVLKVWETAKVHDLIVTHDGRYMLMNTNTVGRDRTQHERVWAPCLLQSESL
jgi:hypothetical protein